MNAVTKVSAGRRSCSIRPVWASTSPGPSRVPAARLDEEAGHGAAARGGGALAGHVADQQRQVAAGPLPQAVHVAAGGLAAGRLVQRGRLVLVHRGRRVGHEPARQRPRHAALLLEVGRVDDGAHRGAGQAQQDLDLVLGERAVRGPPTARRTGAGPAPAARGPRPRRPRTAPRCAPAPPARPGRRRSPGRPRPARWPRGPARRWAASGRPRRGRRSPPGSACWATWRSTSSVSSEPVMSAAARLSTSSIRLRAVSWARKLERS